MEVEAFDLDELAVVRSVGGDELGDDGELFGGIYSLAGPIERGATQSIRIPIAPVGVAVAVRAV